MNRPLSLGVGLAFSLASTCARAQSLEKSYADQCSKPAQQKTEVCQVLAKALMAKLQGVADPAQPVASANTSQRASTSGADNAKWRARWGVYVDLIGKEWTSRTTKPDQDPDIQLGVMESMVYQYRWKVPGEVLEVTTDIGSSHSISTLTWDPTQQRIISGDGWGFAANADGSVDGLEITIGDVTMRTKTVRGPDGTISNTTERKENGVWSTWLVSQMIERTPENLAKLRRELGGDKPKTASADYEQMLADAEARQAEVDGQDAEVGRRRSDRSATSLAGALYDGLTAANQAYDKARAETVVGRAAPRPVSHQPPSPDARPRSATPQDAPPAATAPLRFVMDIGLQPRAGDRQNPHCYSSVVTKPGPPGWGQRGFLPPGSAEAARNAVLALKDSFIAQCRVVSGREITGEGNFHWVWNELADGEQSVSEAGPRAPEDVRVRMD